VDDPGRIARAGLVLPGVRAAVERSVRRIVDRTMPVGTAYRITPEDLMLAAARMQRDGMTRDQVMREMGVTFGEQGVTHEVMDRFLDRARALLDQRIAQGLEPAETRTEVEVPDDEGDDGA
jgi:hypothetical protein